MKQTFLYEWVCIRVCMHMQNKLYLISSLQEKGVKYSDEKSK